jgi:hypothetical protein
MLKQKQGDKYQTQLGHYHQQSPIKLIKSAQTSTDQSKFLPRRSLDCGALSKQATLKLKDQQLTQGFKMIQRRATVTHKIIFSQDAEADGPEPFIAKPTDDIPRNKLVDKLARGLQAYVTRMRKRESFYVTLVKLSNFRA